MIRKLTKTIILGFESEMNPTPEKLDACFSKMNLPKLSEAQTVQVEETITEQEVRNSILSLNKEAFTLGHI